MHSQRTLAQLPSSGRQEGVTEFAPRTPPPMIPRHPPRAAARGTSIFSFSQKQQPRLSPPLFPPRASVATLPACLISLLRSKVDQSPSAPPPPPLSLSLALSLSPKTAVRCWTRGVGCFQQSGPASSHRNHVTSLVPHPPPPLLPCLSFDPPPSPSFFKWRPDSEQAALIPRTAVAAALLAQLVPILSPVTPSDVPPVEHSVVPGFLEDLRVSVRACEGLRLFRDGVLMGAAKKQMAVSLEEALVVLTVVDRRPDDGFDGAAHSFLCCNTVGKGRALFDGFYSWWCDGSDLVGRREGIL